MWDHFSFGCPDGIPRLDKRMRPDIRCCSYAQKCFWNCQTWGNLSCGWAGEKTPRWKMYRHSWRWVGWSTGILACCRKANHVDCKKKVLAILHFVAPLHDSVGNGKIFFSEATIGSSLPVFCHTFEPCLGQFCWKLTPDHWKMLLWPWILKGVNLNLSWTTTLMWCGYHRWHWSKTTFLFQI